MTLCFYIPYYGVTKINCEIICAKYKSYKPMYPKVYYGALRVNNLQIKILTLNGKELTSSSLNNSILNTSDISLSVRWYRKIVIKIVLRLK